MAMRKCRNDKGTGKLQQQRRQDHWKTTDQGTDKSLNILEVFMYTDSETTKTVTGEVLNRVTVSWEVKLSGDYNETPRGW